MGPTLGFLPPLECQKPDTGPPLGPQENVIELEGKRPPRDQHSSHAALLPEAGSQTSGGARQPRMQPTPGPTILNLPVLEGS